MWSQTCSGEGAGVVLYEQDRGMDTDEVKQFGVPDE